jgi:prepilin-type N-terminal cleavage/methylation domain-containing protein
MLRPEPPSSSRRSGFTLIELLVAMVVSGLLAGVIFQLIEGQGRFTSLQSARQEVQQNARASLELIASELRAVPPGAITEATETSIAFRLPRVWGLVCQDLAPGATTAWIAIPAGADPGDFPSPTALSAGTEWGIALESATAGAYDTATISGIPGLAEPCSANLSLTATDGALFRVFAIANLSGSGVALGSRVFLYQRVRYDRALSSSVPGLWIRRESVGLGSVPQPMAGPVVEGSGASRGFLLTYFGTGGALPLPLTNKTDVRRIQVKVSMESRNKKLAQTETDSLAIHLRSR